MHLISTIDQLVINELEIVPPNMRNILGPSNKSMEVGQVAVVNLPVHILLIVIIIIKMLGVFVWNNPETPGEFGFLDAYRRKICCEIATPKCGCNLLSLVCTAVHILVLISYPRVCMEAEIDNVV